jgi:hypothetical protein
VQAQKIYSVLKDSLLEMLSNHHTFLHSRQDELVMKAILLESLPVINE